jgi:tetratricopeptide (TPR) repeat protein
LLDAWREKRGADVDVALAEALDDWDSPTAAQAVLDRALKADPKNWNGRVLLAGLAKARGDPPQALHIYRELNAERPMFEPLAKVLAGLEITEGEPARAVAVLERFGTDASFALRHLLARALFADDRAREALQVARPLVEYLDAEARRGMLGGGVDPQEYQELKTLYQELVAETEGAEAVTVDAARRRQLDARAAVNFTLLAGELMNRSPRIAVHLELKTVQEYEQLGKELLAQDPKSAAGMCQLGIAALRGGDDRRAVELFEAARDADPSHFGALLGSGAARQIDQQHLYREALQLPAAVSWPGLGEVIPDWPALTDLERRVVCASVEPLKWFLPRLAEAGARMHILPLDVRIVDLPEFTNLQAERMENDHRSFAALGGVAHHGVACARIESLLDVSIDGWTFAHEFAHVAHHVFPEDIQRAIEELHRRANGEDEVYAFSQYQLSNPFEFFACAYVDHLLEAHLGVDRLEGQPEGVALETRTFLVELSNGGLKKTG